MSKEAKPNPDQRAATKAPEPQLSQREKFIQAAREAECDETGEKLDQALRTIGRARRATR